MLFQPRLEDRLGSLEERLRHAPCVTRDLLSEIIAEACPRIADPDRRAQAVHVERLVGAGAWIDAAMALVALELPQWRLRRLVHDGGEWHCGLSRQWQLPDWLDDSAEFSHAQLPLAVLGAFIVARIDSLGSAETPAGSVPACRQGEPAFRAEQPGIHALCCENFA